MDSYKKAASEEKFSSFYLTWKFPWHYFVLTWNTKLGAETHFPPCLPSMTPCVMENMYRAKNHNSEPKIPLTANSEFSESSKLLL